MRDGSRTAGGKDETMGIDGSMERGVYSFLTQGARLGNGPMVAVPVESTREVILMDAGEPIQGAIDQYLDDLADRALFQDAILAAMELNGGGRLQDWMKANERTSQEREDIEVGNWHIHPVFEGDRYGADDKLVYGIDDQNRDKVTGLPLNDCQSAVNHGLPLIEFYDIGRDAQFPEVPLDRIPAATVLGLNDPETSFLKTGLAGGTVRIGDGEHGGVVGPREAVAVGRWVEKVSAFRFKAHRDPDAFKTMMADRSELLYETEGMLEDHSEAALFDNLISSTHRIAAARAVVQARGDIISGDRDAIAFMQTLDRLADELKARTFDAMEPSTLSAIAENARESARTLDVNPAREGSDIAPNR